MTLSRVTQQYLEALGLSQTAQAAKPTLELLRTIYDRHSKTIPFHTIHVLEGEDLTMVPEDAVRTLIEEQRGSVCGEQIPLMLKALRELGYDACMKAGEVYLPSGETSTTQLTHRSIMASVDGTHYLVDAGFPSKPVGLVAFTADVDQPMPDGTVWCMQHDAEADLWVLHKRQSDGSLVPIHRIRMQEHSQEVLDKAMDWLFTDECPFQHGWLTQIYREDGCSITMAQGVWAGKAVPADHVKYVKHSATNYEDTVTEVIPLSDARVIELLEQEFKLKKFPRPLVTGDPPLA